MQNAFAQSATNTALAPISTAFNNQRVMSLSADGLLIDTDANKSERRGPACVTEQGPLLDGDDYLLLGPRVRSSPLGPALHRGNAPPLDAFGSKHCKDCNATVQIKTHC